MEVNLYDFDKTIYDGDSTVDFYLFCLKKKPSIIKYIPVFFVYFILYLIRVSSKEKMKEKLFAFLNDFNNINELVEEFWKKNAKKIKTFYLEKEHQNDIIISASPEFLLFPISKKLKVKKLIASRVNIKNGKYNGKNCSGKEKVKRLNGYNNNLVINEVYSDNYKDIPILDLGKKSFLVKKQTITTYKKQTIKKIIIRHLFGLLFVTSNPFMTIMSLGLLDYNYYSFTKYLFILSFIISIIIYKVIIIKQSFNKKIVIISVLIGLYIISNTYNNSQMGVFFLYNLLNNYFKIVWKLKDIKELISLLSIPSICTYVYLVIIKLKPYIIQEYKSLKKDEKQLLLIIFIIGAILTTIIYTNINAFYLPQNCTKTGCIFGEYDVIYTTDTGYLNKYNTFYTISSRENDLRQPLFGLFAMPFSLTAKLISNLFAFIPNSYYIIFNIIQIILLGLTLLMISRFFKQDNANKKIYILLSVCSFSCIAFSFIQEQYIISLFYLILSIYVYHKYKPNINYFYLGAVGTLITSGIIFPTITIEKLKNIKKYILNMIKAFLAFLSITILTGQILVFHPKRFMFLKGFTGIKLSFIEKFKQYLFFIRSIFIAPFGGKEIITKSGYISYRLKDINNYSIIGIIILILCIISFIKNKDKLIAKISFLWIIFSFIVLCIIGWGTIENGLILYSLYFFWAFIVLISLLINNINNIKLKKIILLTTICTMLIVNMSSFIDILKFCIINYHN